MNAAINHMETMLEWARSGRRNRASKIRYYGKLCNEAMVNAKREMSSPNDRTERPAGGALTTTPKTL